MSKVVLIDYGSGNLRSAEKALQKVAAEAGRGDSVVTTSDPEAVAVADRLVLPGVGAFAHCMNLVSAIPGLTEAMTEAAVARGRPFLGVCVGMQLLATRGLEFGETPGLGWIEGGYVKLRVMSRTEKFDRQMAAAQALETAMDECVDQDEEILWPAPEGAVTVAQDHGQFALDQKVGHLVSVPLRLDGKVVAVLTCERPAPAFTTEELQQLRLACDQNVRRLSELKHSDRWFGARWAAQTRERCARWLGPEHTWSKVAGIASHSAKPNFSIRLTQVSAAQNTMAPWAKLNTPEAL